MLRKKRSRAGRVHIQVYQMVVDAQIEQVLIRALLALPLVTLHVVTPTARVVDLVACMVASVECVRSSLRHIAPAGDSGATGRDMRHNVVRVGYPPVASFVVLVDNLRDIPVADSRLSVGVEKRRACEANSI